MQLKVVGMPSQVPIETSKPSEQNILGLDKNVLEKL